MYQGWTHDLTPEQKRANEIAAVAGICLEDPRNEYWRNRLEALTGSRIVATAFSFSMPIRRDVAQLAELQS